MSFAKHLRFQNVSLFFVFSTILFLGFVTPAVNVFLLFGLGLSAHYYICLAFQLEDGYSPFFTPILTAVCYALCHSLLPDLSYCNGAFAISYVLALIPCFLMDKFLKARYTSELLATSIIVSTFVAVLFAF